MDLGLNAKRAFITGGSHGIGLAIARSLAEEGCDIIVCSRNLERLDTCKKECESLGVKCDTISGDVLNDEDIDKIIEFVLQLGGVDILINNVGGGGRWGKESVLETPLSVWKEVLQKNLWAAVKFTIAMLPQMISHKWGRVVTITSIYGVEVGGRAWFNIAKSAEMVLMKNLSTNKEFVRNGVTFNSVAPGYINISNDELETQQKNTSSLEFIADQCPMGRMGIPEEVAPIVTFLCSNQASYINGESISVDGGQSHRF